MGYIVTAADFLVSLILDWISIIFLLAIALHRYRLLLISNPVYSLLSRCTMPAVRMVPRAAGRERERVAFVTALFLAQYLKLMFLMLIGTLLPLQAHGLLLLGVALVFRLAVQVYLFAIIIMVVLSWLAPGHGNSPAVQLLALVTEPALRPLRRHLPALGGLDFSPMLALVLLYLSILLIYQPLADYAVSLR